MTQLRSKIHAIIATSVVAIAGCAPPPVASLSGTYTSSSATVSFNPSTAVSASAATVTMNLTAIVGTDNAVTLTLATPGGTSGSVPPITGCRLNTTRAGDTLTISTGQSCTFDQSATGSATVSLSFTTGTMTVSGSTMTLSAGGTAIATGSDSSGATVTVDYGTMTISATAMRGM